MPVVQFTKAFVKGLARNPVAAQTIFSDPKRPGLVLIARPTGQHTWAAEFRVAPGGRSAPKKRVTVGPVDEITPEDAAKRAAEIRAMAAAGRDPAAERQEERRTESVAELIEQFLTRHVRARRKPRTHELYAQVARSWIAPLIGSAKAAALTRAQVSRMHSDIAAGRGGSKGARGGERAANLAVSILSSCYSWADRNSLVPEQFNPTRRATEKFEERKHERYLDLEELTRLGDAITLGMTDGIAWNIDPTKPANKHTPKNAASQRIKINIHVASAIRLLVFTGARRSEITGLRWDEVDFKRGLLRLKDSKTGKKTIILNAPALAILAELPQVGFYVFPNRADPLNRPMDNFDKAWRAIIRQANLPGLRIHDLRHTHASTGVSDGMSLPMIGRLLGHKNVNTTARYAHLHQDPVRQASERIGRTLASAMGGRAPGGDDGNVVPLRQGSTF